jgi:hypothetical protein
MLPWAPTKLGVVIPDGVVRIVPSPSGAGLAASERSGVGVLAVLGFEGVMLPMLLALVLLGLGGVAWYVGALSRSGDGNATTAQTPPAPEEPETRASSASTTTETTADTQQELLSDEDFVIQLLEENGGRMKQVSIVEQTDWSKSKVSMLLSEMEEDDRISKLRVGRENIISLAGEEPDAAGSPFDTE